MDDLKTELKNKKEKLDELNKSRSNAYCSTVQSTKDDVIRETEIEELEWEIHEPRKKVKINL